MNEPESRRTLTFGERSISYDTEHLTEDSLGGCFPQRVIEPDVDLSEVDSGAPSDFSESDEDIDGVGEEAKETSMKQLITPDVLDMCQLLNFNEDEDDSSVEEVTRSENASDPCEWKKAVVKDLTHHIGKKTNVYRRHSVSDCRKELATNYVSGGPTFSTDVGLQDPGVLCAENKEPATLHLNLREISHIRSVLTKAQLENESVDDCLRVDVEEGRVCFSCRLTRFNLCVKSIICQICDRSICPACISNILVPPSPSLPVPVSVLSPASGHCFKKENSGNCVGSAPGSPRLSHSSPPILETLDVSALVNEKPVQQIDLTRTNFEGQSLQVCRECKEMVLQVIRSKGSRRKI